MSDAPERTLAHIAEHLRRHQVAFALVGGLAVSVRGEVRFTRDVDLAVAVASDEEAEALARGLAAEGYRAIALVEHEARERLAPIRLEAPTGVVVDLLAASSGIEDVVVARSATVPFEGAGEIPVARPEELLALKVLSMTGRRLQDRLDAISLLLANPELDLVSVRESLTLIVRRGYARGQDLEAKLALVLADARAQHD